jgi:hypothetical protein
MSDHALRKLNAMCEVELILGLHDIVPLLECVHMGIKITQGKNIFMCDFVENIKLAQHEFTCYIVILTLYVMIQHLMTSMP